MMITDKKYTTSANAKGGKNAKIITDDGLLNLEYQPPVELQGSGKKGKHTNPEQLLAAGYAGCMSSSIQLAAEKLQKNVDPSDIKVTATVHMGDDQESSGFGYSIELDISIGQLESEEKSLIIETAHKECPYYKSMKGNVDIKVNILE